MSRYIDVIANAIKDERCVLMLGPNLWIDKDNKLIQKDLDEYIKTLKDIEVKYDVDGFFSFQNKSAKTFFYSDLRKFYDRYKEPNEIHKKIAQIPFNAIINASPDMMMKQSYEALGLKHDYQFYNKKQNPKDIDKPAKERPLVYNFFGSIVEEDSLILTSDDLFEFLFSVLGGEQRLPRELKSTIKSTKIFLFLGFDFNQWYLKLILRLFDLHKETLPFTEKSDLGDGMKAFYIDNFAMEFIDLSANECVDKLFDIFKTEGFLKEINLAKENPMTTRIKNYVKSDEIDKALVELEDYLDGKSDDLLNVVIQQSGMYNRLQRQIKNGTIAEENSKLEINKISEAIISIADELKSI